MRWPWSPPELVTVNYPHARVNINVTQQALRGMAMQSEYPEGEIVWEGARVNYEQHAVATLFFPAALGLTEFQAKAIGHGLSHLTAQLTKMPDRTHEKDGGRL